MIYSTEESCFNQICYITFIAFIGPGDSYLDSDGANYLVYYNCLCECLKDITNVNVLAFELLLKNFI